MCYCVRHVEKMDYFVQCKEHGAWIECPYSLIKDFLRNYMENERGKPYDKEDYNDEQSMMYTRVLNYEKEAQEQNERISRRYPMRFGVDYST